MATTNHTLKGAVKWAKVFEENRDMEGFEGAARAFDGQYIINFVLDKANREALKASGSAARPSLDKDDDMIVKFKRKHKDRFEWASGAPKVTKPDGSVWDYKTDGPIANGSICEVDIEVYTTKMSNGTRLKEVRVIEAAELPPREPQPEAEVTPTPTKKTYSKAVDLPF